MDSRPEWYFAFSRDHARALAAGAGPDESLGRAMGAELASRAPVVDADNVLAGAPGTRSLVWLDSGGLSCAYEVPAELRGTDLEAEARATIDQWRPRTTACRFAEATGDIGSVQELRTRLRGFLEEAAWDDKLGRFVEERSHPRPRS